MNWQDNPDLIEKGLNYWLELMEKKLKGESISIAPSMSKFYKDLGIELTKGQVQGLTHKDASGIIRYVKRQYDIDLNISVRYWQKRGLREFVEFKQKIKAKLKIVQDKSNQPKNQEEALRSAISSSQEDLSGSNRLKKIGRDVLKMIRKESLSKIIKVSPGFKSVVNVQNDFSDVNKIAAYIPTKISVDIFVDLADNLHEAANRRSKLIMGTYGTGKSHILLFLANFLIRPIDDQAIKPFMDKLSKWPEQKRKIEEIKNDHRRKFLIVLLEGDKGDFNDALLRALDKALAEAGLEDFLPDTTFQAALRRIDELEKSHQSSYEKLEGLVEKEGLISIDALRENLRNFNTRTYNKFLEVHMEVSAGAPFYHHHLMEPKEVYSHVAEELRETGEYEGIVVIWDEFGRYMERVVEDPESNDAHRLQKFAESCNGSGKKQIHFYLACHRSLDEYVALGRYKDLLDSNEYWEKEFKKVSGRFREFKIRTGQEEIYDLIDKVIVQKEGEKNWEDFATNSRDWFDKLTDDVHQMNLFPNLTRDRVYELITFGAYPLHPVTTYCLPFLSEEVAQNERTLFTFLSDSGSDTLGGYYLEKTSILSDERPSMFTIDILFDYFSDQIEAENRTRQIYHQYQQAMAKVSPDDKMAIRVLKALAVINVVSLSSGGFLKPTANALSFSLYLDSEGEKELKLVLDRLSSGMDRVLHKSRVDGSYKFLGGTFEPIEPKIQEIISQNIIHPIKHLKSIWGKLVLPYTVVPTAYNDDFHIERSMIIDVALAADLENFNYSKWLLNLGNKEFVDGYAIVVLAENETQVEKAKNAAVTKLYHEQIIVGIPNRKFECLLLLKKHQALKHLEESQANIYGEGAEQRDIWEDTNEEYLELLRKRLKPLFEPEEERLDWYANGEEVNGIFSTSRLRRLASDRMRDVFPLTPPIPHEKITTEDGKDTIRKYREPVIDKIFQKDGPDQLPKETGAQKHVINAILINNGILRRVGEGYVLEKPDHDVYEGMAAVWDRVEKTIEKAKEKEVSFVELIKGLKSPPFGIRSRCIPVILACVFRKHVLNGNLTLRYRSSKGYSVETKSFSGKVLEQEVMKTPNKYYIRFSAINMPQRLLLATLKDIFEEYVGKEKEDERVGEALKIVSTGIVNWFRDLPQYSLQTQKLSSLTNRLRNDVFKPLAKEGSDSHELLLSKLPAQLEFDLSKPYDSNEEINEALRNLAVKLKNAKEGMENAVNNLKEDTKLMLREVFDSEDKCQDAFSSLSIWYDNLPSDKKQHKFTGDSGTIMKACKNPKEAPPEGDELVVSTAKELTGVAIEDWQDNTLDVFRGRLEGAKRNIDEFEPPTIEEGGSSYGFPLKPGYIGVSITENEKVFKKSFKVPEKLNELCSNLENLIQNSIEGFKRNLTEEECLTVLTRILERELKE